MSIKWIVWAILSLVYLVIQWTVIVDLTIAVLAMIVYLILALGWLEIGDKVVESLLKSFGLEDLK